jgi:hypothetical protein
MGHRTNLQNRQDRANLENRVSEGIQGGDLDAHLACLVLTYVFHELSRTPFVAEINSLREKQFEPKKGRLRPHDAAVLGVRLSLSWSEAEYKREFPEICALELRRQPLPPLETIQTDPRLLIGIAAGAGAIEGYHEYRQELWKIADAFREREGVSPWVYVLACWAQRLLADSSDYAEVAGDLARYLIRRDAGFSVRDRAATLWVITNHDVFMPGIGQDEFERLEDLREDLERVVDAGEAAGSLTGALGSAFLYAALGSGRKESRRRRAVQATLDVIEVFDQVARRLAHARRKGKNPYIVEDEYDVQDLFYAMLLPALPDLEPEDPTIKHAGSSKKIDFVSRQGRIGVEIKYVRSEQTDKDIEKDLKVDIESYHIHPACKTLIIFIYDPRHRILEPRILERDLSGSRSFDGRAVELITRIRPR